jgi:hypothetical protein
VLLPPLLLVESVLLPPLLLVESVLLPPLLLLPVLVRAVPLVSTHSLLVVSSHPLDSICWHFADSHHMFASYF